MPFAVYKVFRGFAPRKPRAVYPAAVRFARPIVRPILGVERPVSRGRWCFETRRKRRARAPLAPYQNARNLGRPGVPAQPVPDPVPYPFALDTPAAPVKLRACKHKVCQVVKLSHTLSRRTVQLPPWFSRFVPTVPTYSGTFSVVCFSLYYSPSTRLLFYSSRLGRLGQMTITGRQPKPFAVPYGGTFVP